MIHFLLLLTAAAAFEKDALRTGLQSAGGQLHLFRDWMKAEHVTYSAREQGFRFRLFRERLQEIVAINDAQDKYEVDMNFMAGLTEQEQQQWYGINITALPATMTNTVDSRIRITAMPTADSKLWREEGKVTPVKNQAGCGSCWTFAGIASFEGHYAVQSGVLRRFAEQEFLDCTYEDEGWNGCNGGWYWEAFDMVKKTQHLSLEKDYAYKARDGKCLTSSKPNGMKAVKSEGTVRSTGDDKLVQGLQMGPVAMAFEIKGEFSYYKKGVLSIRNCGKTPHHAMAVTGYTPEFFEVKNSWGSGWGDKGYVRFDRSINNMCGISNWNAYPVLVKDGDDTDPTDHTDPTDGPNPTADPNCEDKNDKCPGWADRGECKNNWRYMLVNCQKSCGVCGCSDGSDDCARWKESGYCEKNYTNFMSKMCRKSCGLCEESECPDGLVFCKGKCQHEHFC